MMGIPTEKCDICGSRWSAADYGACPNCRGYGLSPLAQYNDKIKDKYVREIAALESENESLKAQLAELESDFDRVNKARMIAEAEAHCLKNDMEDRTYELKLSEERHDFVVGEWITICKELAELREAAEKVLYHFCKNTAYPNGAERWAKALRALLNKD